MTLLAIELTTKNCNLQARKMSDFVSSVPKPDAFEVYIILT